MVPLFGTVCSQLSQDFRCKFPNGWNHILCHLMPMQILTKYTYNLESILLCLLSSIYTLFIHPTLQKLNLFTFHKCTHILTHTLQQLQSPPAKLNSIFQISLSKHQLLRNPYLYFPPLLSHTPLLPTYSSQLIVLQIYSLYSVNFYLLSYTSNVPVGALQKVKLWDMTMNKMNMSLP